MKAFKQRKGFIRGVILPILLSTIIVYMVTFNSQVNVSFQYNAKETKKDILDWVEKGVDKLGSTFKLAKLFI